MERRWGLVRAGGRGTLRPRTSHVLQHGANYSGECRDACGRGRLDASRALGLLLQMFTAPLLYYRGSRARLRRCEATVEADQTEGSSQALAPLLPHESPVVLEEEHALAAFVSGDT